MHGTALTHLIAGLLIVVVSWPLIKGKIGRNYFYGIRTQEALASDQNWREINAYGGRMFLRFGIFVIIIGLVGLRLPPDLWFFYDMASLAVIIGGLIMVLTAIRRYPGGSKKP